MAFNDLTTEVFRKRLIPAAIQIYQWVFPGCDLIDLRGNGKGTHVLDSNFAIDAVICMPDGSFMTLQEKYRNNMFLTNHKLKIEPPLPDFTQEHKNAVGTSFESNGEWFHLAAQLYFFGWANVNGLTFDEWILLDVLKYKIIVYQNGGLDKMGKWRKNKTHGSASFYCIPLCKIKDAIINASPNINNFLTNGVEEGE